MWLPWRSYLLSGQTGSLHTLALAQVMAERGLTAARATPYVVVAACLPLGLRAPGCSEDCSDGAGQLQLQAPAVPVAILGLLTMPVQAQCRPVFFCVRFVTLKMCSSGPGMACRCFVVPSKTAFCKCVYWNCIRAVSAPWLWEWQVDRA